MNLERISYDPEQRAEQLEEGPGPNNPVRASDLNKVIDFLNKLNLLVNATDDTDAATKNVEIGELYRTTSTLKIRVS